MLGILFGSEVKVQLIKLFLANPDVVMSRADLASQTATKGRNLVKEIESLETIGFIAGAVGSEDGYQLQQDFPLLAELRALFTRGLILMEREMMRKVRELKGIKLLVFTGAFIGREDLGTDVLMVGALDRKAVTRLMGHLSSDFGQEFRYTILTTTEYNHRRAMTDKFLFEVLNSQPIIAIDDFS